MQSLMENSDCGIAASADRGASAAKIRYDIEIKRKFQFFFAQDSIGQANRVLNLRIARQSFKFLLPDGKFGKPALVCE
jgi:hypothetical protein